MKFRLLLPFLFLPDLASAQREVILPLDSDGWAYSRALSDANQQFPPREADPDFWATWIDQSFGNYVSPLKYDGPAFQANSQAPFSAGTVPGIQSGTSLDLPADATWQYGYFLKEIDGGALGYQNLNLKVLARDGAVFYLNGRYLAKTPFTTPNQSGNPTISQESDGTTLLDLGLNQSPSLYHTLRPGPNLLAVVAGRVPGQNDDFGLKVEITGEPGLPPLTPLNGRLVDNQLHLRWATATPQKTLVRVTNLNAGNTSEIIESESTTRRHDFSYEIPYPGSQPTDRFSFEILKPDLKVWESDPPNGLYTSVSVSISGFAKETLLTHEDPGWHYLQVRDPLGNDIDPTLSDPDFNETWFRQLLPDFGLPPFEPALYNGPSFSPGPTPIHYGTAHDFPNPGTELTPPSGGEGHTLWLLKSIDGGSTGYRNLELSMRLRGEAYVYLNGDLLYQTEGRNDTDTWTSPANDWQFTRVKNLSTFAILNPGPNLLAVSVHNAGPNLSSLGFSAELKGRPQRVTNVRDVKALVFGNAFSLTYLSGTAQPTLVKITPKDGESRIHEISGDRIFHQFEAGHFAENTTYTYEILASDGLSFPLPVTGQFIPRRTVLIPESSTGWQILNPLDGDGHGIDPQLSDPDFNSTWMTLGMPGSPYDGPDFTPDQPAPFLIDEVDAGLTGTTLAHPGENRSGAIYFVREIDGGPMGAWNLDFKVTSPRACRLYLNGELIVDHLGLDQPERSWDLYWESPSREPSSKLAILRPGKNILALSLHPQNENQPALDFDFGLAASTSFEASSHMTPLADPVIDHSTTTIQWKTSTLSPTSLRYGPGRNQMTNTINIPETAFIHLARIPNPDPGSRLYYELLKPDGSSFIPPAINSLTAPQPFIISDPTLRGVDFPGLALSWNTSTPATTLLRYGLEPDSLDQVSQNTELKTSHRVTFPESLAGGLFTYELVATDANGATATASGSFAIHPQIMRGPFLQKAAPTSMTIQWRTRTPGATVVRYGQDAANLSRVVSGTSAPAPFPPADRPELDGVLTDHSVTIDQLQPGTKYYYQIGFQTSPAANLDRFFTTPPLPGTPAKTRIWVVGDSGKPGTDVRNVKDAYLQYAADTPADLWLMLGDNAYNSGTDLEYQTAFFDIFPELLQNTPVWPTVGNHDGYTDHYYGIFDLPTDDRSGGVPSGTEKYYAFDHGNIHFICLNSEEDPVGMIDWLKTDLQATRADWIIAFFHHGPYTKGSHDSDLESKHFVARLSYLTVLENYGVDLVLSGHSHQYERSHLLDGHYGKSDSYREEDHALDSGSGSAFGITDRHTGLFNYSPVHAPYHKKVASSRSGQVSATVGASSKLSPWRDTAGGDPFAITHPNPHPVHIATIRAIGSLIIDIEGRTLHASYLDSNGQIRDHFQINKSPEESPSITWWQDHFGPESYPYFADWFADPDRDTHDNLTEFIHGGDPFQKEQLIEATLTTGLHEGETAQFYTIQYDRREGAQVAVEASHNLVEFTATGIESTRLTPPDARGIARWQSRLRRTDNRPLFFRIRRAR